MTDEMYARIREIADEHDGNLDVTIAHPGLLTPVIAFPRLRLLHHPEVYMTEDDLEDFRARIAAEGLRRAEHMTDSAAQAMAHGRSAHDAILRAANRPASPTTQDYSRYLDCVYAGRHRHLRSTVCPLCGCRASDFDVQPNW